MALFQRGDFTLNSGVKSKWKIDCDIFTPSDWNTLALMVVEKGFRFCGVIPVPKGKSESNIDNAMRFATALQQYRQESPYMLIVDDVYTTGGSIRACRGYYASPEKYTGIVAFARNPIAAIDRNWVLPIFQSW